MMAKVDPYLRPLYDALFDMLEPENVQRLIERGDYLRDGHIFDVYKHVDGQGNPWPGSTFTGVDDGRLDAGNGAPLADKILGVLCAAGALLLLGIGLLLAPKLRRKA